MAKQVVVTLPAGAGAPDLTQAKVVQLVEEAAKAAGIKADELVLHHQDPAVDRPGIVVTWTRVCFQASQK